MTGGDGLLCQSDLAFPFGETVTADRRWVRISAPTSYASVFEGPTQEYPLTHLLDLDNLPENGASINSSAIHADAFTPGPVFVPEPGPGLLSGSDGIFRHQCLLSGVKRTYSPPAQNVCL